MGELTTPKLIGITVLLGAAMLYGVALLSDNETVDTTRNEVAIEDDKQVELPVVLEEFSDFECPACGAYFPVLEQIKEDYGDKLDFQYKHFPLQNIHPNAYNAALAYEAAKDQGMADEYHDLLFENQTALSEDDLEEYAKELELDFTDFQKYRESDEAKETVDSDIEDGDERGITGTPTFFIEGDQVKFGLNDNPEEKLRALIDLHIERAEAGEDSSEDKMEEDGHSDAMDSEDGDKMEKDDEEGVMEKDEDGVMEKEDSDSDEDTSEGEEN